MTKIPTHIYGIWFIPHKNRQMDWMAQLYVAEGKWHFEYRFRYYSEDSTNPHDGKDRKSWSGFVAPDDSIETRDASLIAIQKIIPVLEEELEDKASFVLLDCKPDDPKILFELGSKPWCHVRLPTKEEADRLKEQMEET